MFGLNSEEFLSQVQERVEQSKSNYFLIQRRAKFGIVAIETIGSQVQKVYGSQTEMRGLMSLDLNGKVQIKMYGS